MMDAKAKKGQVKRKKKRERFFSFVNENCVDKHAQHTIY